MIPVHNRGVELNVAGFAFDEPGRARVVRTSANLSIKWTFVRLSNLQVKARANCCRRQASVTM